MRRLSTLIAVVVMLPSLAWTADDRLVAKKSPHSVGMTLDRLSEALKTRGIAVVARVDHAGAAERVGQSLRPTQLLLFGSPKLGTSLMQANRRTGSIFR